MPPDSLVKLMEEHEPLRTKVGNCRKAMVEKKVRHPGCRPRHEKFDMKLFTEKQEKDFATFQDVTYLSFYHYNFDLLFLGGGCAGWNQLFSESLPYHGTHYWILWVTTLLSSVSSPSLLAPAR